MEQLNLDLDFTELALPGGVLRFEAADPNLYHRLLTAGQQLEELQTSLTPKAEKAEGRQALELLAEADRQAKQILNDAFGRGTDLDALLLGTSLLAVCRDGRRVVTALLETLTPVLEQGARRFYDAAADAEIQAADQRASALAGGSQG